MVILCALFDNVVSPKGCQKNSPNDETPNMFGSYLEYNYSTPSHTQIRCKKLPRFMQTRPRCVFKSPGAEKQRLGTRDRKIGFSCCLIMPITSRLYDVVSFRKMLHNILHYVICYAFFPDSWH